MAAVPYEHIEAPDVIRIDGTRAFNPGDPVPIDTARRLGLLDGDDAPPILPAYGSPLVPGDFSDAAIKVIEQGADGTAAGSGPQSTSTADSTTATSTQTPVKAPKPGPAQQSTPSS